MIVHSISIEPRWGANHYSPEKIIWTLNAGGYMISQYRAATIYENTHGRRREKS
jgi:hypothetical protein